MASDWLVAVTNTTPIISLVGIDQLHLLDELFERVIVPTQVWDELADKPDAPELDAVLGRKNFSVLPAGEPPLEARRLHGGERAAIALAQGRRQCALLLDEKHARAVARSLDLPVVGTLGVLVEAKRRGLIHEVRPLIDGMIRHGCRLGPSLIAHVLEDLGEAST